MALKAVLESLDGVSDAIKTEYKKADNGKFVLDVIPVEGLGLENAAGLKTALSAERKSVGELKTQLKVFEGIDVEAAKKALEFQAELGGLDLSEHKKATEALKVKEQQLQTKFENDRKKDKEKFDTDLAAERKRAGAYEGQLKNILVTSVANRAIADAGGKPALLIPIIEKYARATPRDSGEYAVQVYDDQGQVRLSNKSGSTDPMTVPEFVDFLKSSKDYESAFAASGSSGGGTSGGAGGRGNGFTITSEQAKDVNTYRAAKEAATKAGQPLQIVG